MSIPLIELLLAALVSYYALPTYYQIELSHSPPNNIFALDDSINGIEGLQGYEYMFVLPNEVKVEDIRYWDGTTLTYESSLSPDEIVKYYANIYHKAGFTPAGSSGDTSTERFILFRIDDDTDTSIVFIVRAGETTLVKVALCFKLSDCFHIELD